MFNKDHNLNWDGYFKGEKKSFFHNLLSLHRWIFISRAVKFYTDKYFKKKGIFLEAGAGTSQSSIRISRLDRKLIALDQSAYVLAKHNILDYKIQGNILELPIKPESLDGIWNLGVMEHLTDLEIIKSLKEFNLVMKKEAVLLIFWPPFFAPFQVVLKIIAWVLLRVFGKHVEFFPNEINLYKNKKRLLQFLDAADFRLLKKSFNILDMFSYVVVIARKKA